MVGLRQSCFKYRNYRVLHKHAKGAIQNCKNLLLLLMHLGKSWEAVNVVRRNLSYGKATFPLVKKKKSWKTRTVASRRDAWPVIDRHEMSTPIQDMYVGSGYRWSQAVWGVFQLTQILHQIGQLQICPVEFGFASVYPPLCSNSFHWTLVSSAYFERCYKVLPCETTIRLHLFSLESPPWQFNKSFPWDVSLRNRWGQAACNRTIFFL